MAEVADICTESTPVISEKASECHKDKEIGNTCDLVTSKEMSEKGDSTEIDEVKTAPEASAAATTEATPEVEMISPETADTTGGTPTTGTKRKCEDESTETSEDLKKVKSDAVAETSEADPKDVITNGGSSSDNNGCHAGETEATNGKETQDIPAEIVTKSVEEALKPCEDIAASS